MLIGADNDTPEIWNRIQKLPIVLCHRDFWVTNIFYSDKKIVLIDWDTTGWGYMGEDIKQLITDETDADYWLEYYRKLVPAYFRGFSEYTDISIGDNYVWEMIILKCVYDLVR
jgi:thiamine kinase-like enzyme